jgi:hypothetical protein
MRFFIKTDKQKEIKDSRRVFMNSIQKFRDLFIKDRN